tara:strand:+ start:359 stop:1063 length:705 start_codon:yes stop_codon:yes gene_type:complete
MNQFMGDSQNQLKNTAKSLTDNIKALTQDKVNENIYNKTIDAVSNKINESTNNVIISSSDSVESNFSWWTLIKYVIIIGIIIFLAINIFSHLGKNFLKDINLFDNEKESINKENDEEDGEENNKDNDTEYHSDDPEFKRKKEIDEINYDENNLNNGISNIEKQFQYNNRNSVDFEADDASISTQKNKVLSKPGFCYIGEERGFRSCIKVGMGDKCMSGDIFPTRELCINPNLRQ